jgi:hypothetical protein
MKLVAHLSITVIATFGGAIIGFALAAITAEMGYLREYPPLFYFAPAIFLGGLIPRLLMKRLFPEYSGRFRHANPIDSAILFRSIAPPHSGAFRHPPVEGRISDAG